MHMHPTIYRGFAVYLSGADSDWSFRVERLKPDVPLLAHPVSEGHSRGGKHSAGPSVRLTAFWSAEFN